MFNTGEERKKRDTCTAISAELRAAINKSGLSRSVKSGLRRIFECKPRHIEYGLGILSGTASRTQLCVDVASLASSVDVFDNTLGGNDEAYYNSEVYIAATHMQTGMLE